MQEELQADETEEPPVVGVLVRGAKQVAIVEEAEELAVVGVLIGEPVELAMVGVVVEEAAALAAVEKLTSEKKM